MGVDDTDPAIDDVTSSDYNKVEITFTEAFDIADIEVAIAESYGDKDDLAILDMEYSGKDKLVVTTTEQADSTLYEVEVDGLTDLAGNTVNDLTATFTGQEMDTDEQTVLDAAGKDSVTVNVEFRTKVEEASALDAANYTITEQYGDKDEVVVVAAEFYDADADDDVDVDDTNFVRLTLASDTSDATLYNLAVENVGTLYGEALDTDNDEVTFTGVGPDEDEPASVTATSDSNTEVTVSVTDDSDIDADSVTAGMFTIAERYGDKDELVVIAIKEMDVDAETPTITLTTSEQSEATLYELTVAEGLADKFGNVTTDELTATFTGSGVADEITTVTATNPADKKVLVGFNRNYGDGALSVINYKIDGGIGYPTKVEAVDADDVYGNVNIDSDNEGMYVLLTVSELTIGDIYELTVKNVDNSDGVAMDADGVTDKFAAQKGADSSKITLEAVVATDDQTLKLYFDKDVADIDGLVDANNEIAPDISIGALSGYALQYKFEGNLLYTDLTGYAYEDPSNTQVLIVQTDINAAFNNTNNGEDELYLMVDSEEVADIDTDTDANIVKFAENTSDISDITVDGVVALDSYTLKVYFNQAVRNVTHSTFANVVGNFDGAGSDETVGFTDSYSNNDEKTEWTFVLSSPMTSDTDSKLDFTVAAGSAVNVHTGGSVTSDIVFSAELADQTVEFSKNTSNTDYIDEIGVVMTDSKTIKVIYPENMNSLVSTDAGYDADKTVVNASNYAFVVESSAATTPDSSNGTGTAIDITQVVYDDDENTVYLTTDDTFGDSNTSYSKLYLEIAAAVSNKAGNKVVKDDQGVAGVAFTTEFSVSTASAADIAINDVVATQATTTSGSIVIELDQAVTTSGALVYDATTLLDDFSIDINGTPLTSGNIDVNSIDVENYSETTEDAALVPIEASKITITVSGVAFDINNTVEVEIIDDVTLTGSFNGEMLDIESTGVTSVVK